MVDMLSLDLVDKNLLTDTISLTVGYSKDEIKPAGGTKKLGEYTNSAKKLVNYFTEYYKKTVKRGYPIRKLNIGFLAANRILDRMTEEGIASDAEGAKPRTLLISREELPYEL